ncbi:glycosyltransferase, partial [Sphingomonas sp. 22L2VL55-3]
NNAIIFGGGDHLPSAEPLGERYTFGFVGRLLPHKGAHIVISALPADASIIIAGQARDEYYEHLKNLAHGKNVTFIEDASDVIVASIYRSIRFLLVPSVEQYGAQTYARPELLGLVALEALAAGTPVIGSDVGGLSQVLRTAGQRVLPPGDIQAWAEGLSAALTGEPPTVPSVDFTWGLWQIAV